MKIMSFNINGLKSFTKFIKQKFNVSFNDYLINNLKVDILCLQEVKCIKKDMDEFNSLKDYITFTNLNQYKNGIYGVSTIISKKMYCRKHNIKVPYSEYGRSILTDHKDFKILNLYCPFYDPNGSKTKESVIKFYYEIYNFIKDYDDLLILGDFNAVYSVFDHFVYYKEFVKIYDRKNNTQNHVLEILDQFQDPFKNKDFPENYKRVISRHDESPIIKNGDNSNLCKLFGENIRNFLELSQSPYLNYIYRSLRYLQDITFDFSENIESKDVDFKLDLLEKSFYSVTDLPYLVDNVPTLILLLYSTFQRKWMLKLILEMSHIDSFRLFHSEDGRYTCWNTQLSLRSVNMGTRIDYILVPVKFYNRIIYSDILDNVYGSDHCPVYINFSLEVEDDWEKICKVRNNILGFLRKRDKKS